jgi:inhibitor of cysteine peptidase
MKRIFALLVTAILSAACSQSTGPSDPGIQIETRAGQEFKIILESNPSTGYHWEIIGELDASIVELASREYRADLPITAGSGGSDVFVFRAVGPGETTITLGYYPPSNDPIDPEQLRAFTVIVE